jgi:hypothetical protein
MKLLRGLFDHSRRHHDTREMPAWVRRRLYRHLIDLMEEEERVRRVLDLPVAPRLSVVDEVRVAMLAPRDRAALRRDEEMQRAREDERDEEEQARSGETG